MLYLRKSTFTPYAALLLYEVAFVKIWYSYESGVCGTAVTMEEAS